MSSPLAAVSFTPALPFLRGGKLADEGTATSDETSSLDVEGSVNMQLRYGTNDEESSSDSDGVPADMIQPPATVDLETAELTSTESSPTLSSPLLAAVAPVVAQLGLAGSLYSQQLTRRPVLTKSLTACVIFGLSDWCAQMIEREGSSPEEGGDVEPIVLSRILTVSLVGLLVYGPAANAWYTAILKLLPSKSLLSILQKAVLGQLVFGPAYTCVFFGAGMVRSGSFSPGAWLSKIRSDLPAVWASGLLFWLSVDIVSYRAVPPRWILLFVNFCSFVWTIYLSMVANRDGGRDGVDG